MYKMKNVFEKKRMRMKLLTLKVSTQLVVFIYLYYYVIAKCMIQSNQITLYTVERTILK